MEKIRFHNSQTIDVNLDKKQSYQNKNVDPKIVVDINKLLNRVKIEENKELKRKIIFFSLIIICLSFIGMFIAFNK